ncbi:MAG: polysaccharide lyase family 7 protein [Pseudomonadota bacterium]
MSTQDTRHAALRPLASPLLMFATLCLGAAVAPMASAELNSALPPGGNFALENWNITIPVDAHGGVSGPPLTLPPSTLSGPYGYSNRPYFYTEADGAMTFWAPLNGTTAGGSNSPRAEMRELLDPNSTRVNWNSFVTSFLDAQVRVLQVPNTDGLVIVSQVHGYQAAPLVLVYYRYDSRTGTGKIMTKLQGTPIQGPPYTQHVIASNIGLGQRFSYHVRVERPSGGPAVVSVSANGGPAASMQMEPSWDRETFYFKAGAYLHSNGSSASEGALVKFYQLAASHPAYDLTITSAGTLPSAGANRPYQVALQASGGFGGGTWRLVSGFPPAGLNLDSSGVISGTPLPSAVAPLPDEFMVQVRDANGSTYSKLFSILVQP